MLTIIMQVRQISPEWSKRGQFRIEAEVQDALERRRPVVALESTIISHGMEVHSSLRTTRGRGIDI